MNTLLTRILLRFGAVLYHAGLYRLVMRANRRAPKVLVYHSVDDQESACTLGLDSNTTPSTFARHLEFLARHYRVVPLSHVVNGQAAANAVAITFDDGYQSVHRVAAPLLQRRQMPATVLLVTDVVDNDALVWVNELAFFLHEHSERTRAALSRWLPVRTDATASGIVHLAKTRFDASAIERTLVELRKELHVDAREHAGRAQLYLTWDECSEMTRAGFSFGSHTASHPNLTRLAPALQRRELERARDTIAARLGGCTAFAYPFGLWNASALEGALGAGHEIVLEVGGVNRSLDPHHVARIPVRAETDAQLFAEIEVVAPLRARLRLLRESARSMFATLLPSWRGVPAAAPEVQANHAPHR